MKTNNSIIITGGFGFIGKALIPYLQEITNEIVVIDDLSLEGKNSFPAGDRIRFFQSNITNKKELDDIFAEVRPSAVIHLAAKHYIPYCDSHADETIETNVQGTRNIIELMGKYKCPRLIFSSSAAVYTPSSKAHIENEDLNPIDVYGKSKQEGERIILSLCPSLGIDYTILRLFNVFGPNDLTPHLIPILVKQAQVGNTITVGNVLSKRDYVWVDDIVNGILKTLANNESNGQVINLGRGEGWSVRDIFNELSLILKRDFILEIDESKKRAVDVPILLSDVQKAKEILGWQPQICLKEGLSKILIGLDIIIPRMGH